MLGDYDFMYFENIGTKMKEKMKQSSYMILNILKHKKKRKKKKKNWAKVHRKTLKLISMQIWHGIARARNGKMVNLENTKDEI